MAKNRELFSQKVLPERLLTVLKYLSVLRPFKFPLKFLHTNVNNFVELSLLQGCPYLIFSSIDFFSLSLNDTLLYH